MSNLSTDGAATTTSTVQQRGRPRKTVTKSCAERAKTYRDRLKSEGLREVKCFLRPEHLHYLQAIRDIHGGTIADAVAVALTAVLRGEISAPSSGHESPPQSSAIHLG